MASKPQDDPTALPSLIGPCHVLSVQSAVVHGFVGNRVAVHALHCHGIVTDALPTVSLSNHTGYAYIEPIHKPQKLSPESEVGASSDTALSPADETKRQDLLRVFNDGLVANNLTNGYTHVLSGYVGSVGALLALAEIVKSLRKSVGEAGANGGGERVKFFCDPVMGDDGRLYVPESSVEIYRKELIPLADAMFPNQTEIELLTGKSVKTEADAFEAISVLHTAGVETVVVTSLCLSDGDSSDHEEFITLLGSTQEGRGARWRMRIPRLDQSFTGTGDLFSALMVAWLCRGLGAVEACEKSVNTVFAIVNETFKAESNELLLIQGQRYLLYPPAALTVERLK